MGEKLLSTAWEVHRCIWERFVHAETNVVETRLGDGGPLEDCPPYAGLFIGGPVRLPAMMACRGR